MKKSTVLFFIFTLLSLSAFAAPGGAGGNNNGGGNRGGSNNRTAPSRSPRNTPRNGSSSQMRSESLKSDSQSPSMNANQNQSAGTGTEQKSTGTEASSATSSESQQMTMDDFINYRGNRTLIPNDAFLLEEIRTERVDSLNVTLEISFNQSINPRSLSCSSIKINGETLSDKTAFAFNKKGDTVKLTIPVQKNNFTLEITDVQSFDGTVLAPIEIRGVSDNSLSNGKI